MFGGNFEPSLDSVERFHRTQRIWQTGPNMLSPKAAFTPCEHHGLIYLPEASPCKKLLKMLNSVTEVYILLPLQLHINLYGSFSFIADNNLFMIDYNRKACTWNLESKKTELTPLHINVKKSLTAISVGLLLDSEIRYIG